MKAIVVEGLAGNGYEGSGWMKMLFILNLICKEFLVL